MAPEIKHDILISKIPDDENKDLLDEYGEWALDELTNGKGDD